MNKEIVLHINKGDFIDWAVDIIADVCDFGNYIYSVLDCGLPSINEMNTQQDLFDYISNSIPTYTINTPQHEYNKKYDSTDESTNIEYIDEEFCVDELRVSPDEVKIVWDK
jgi:hypothetical protein